MQSEAITRRYIKPEYLSYLCKWFPSIPGRWSAIHVFELRLLLLAKQHNWLSLSTDVV